MKHPVAAVARALRRRRFARPAGVLVHDRSRRYPRRSRRGARHATAAGVTFRRTRGRCAKLFGYVLQFNGAESSSTSATTPSTCSRFTRSSCRSGASQPPSFRPERVVFRRRQRVGVDLAPVTNTGVIISSMIANGGCPCPASATWRFGLSDTVLHFVYNALACAASSTHTCSVVRQRGYVFRPRTLR